MRTVASFEHRGRSDAAQLEKAIRTLLDEEKTK